MSATRTLLLCTLTMLALATFKAYIAYITGSVAVLAESIHSGIDALVIFIGTLLVWHSGRGSDGKYRYGRGRFENVSALAEGSFVFLAGIVLGYEALSHSSDGAPSLLGSASVLASGAVVYGLVRYLRVRSRELESPALWANSVHLTGDVWAATAVGLGLLIAPALPQAWPVDQILALGVAVVISFSGFILVRGSLTTLADKSLSDNELEPILHVLNHPPPGVTGYHHLRSRASGPVKHLDFHLTVNSHMNVQEAHQICDELENKLEKIMPNLDVTIHLEPEGWEE